MFKTILVTSALLASAIPGSVITYQSAPENPATSVIAPIKAFYEPTQRQEVWLSALEWCESSGVHEAINPKDLDGTPSLGAFQFKPSTFELYSKKYGIEGELMNRDTQRLIVSQMLNDDSVKWRNQFPDCVSRLGYPPK